VCVPKTDKTPDTTPTEKERRETLDGNIVRALTPTAANKHSKTKTQNTTKKENKNTRQSD